VDVPESHEITLLLERWSSGDREALDQLMPLVYYDLRRAARAYLNSERPGHTLQPTALVHEAYLRLVHLHSPKIENRKHFLVIAAQALRRVLVDHARQRGTARRDRRRLPAGGGLTIPPDQNVDLLALDDALHGLAAIDPDKARLVELRYFAGLSVAETAEVLGRSAATVKREWTLAKLWLYRRINGENCDDTAAVE
jgi:RNA polymerase sigma factor (TIGR02999 family)